VESKGGKEGDVNHRFDAVVHLYRCRIFTLPILRPIPRIAPCLHLPLGPGCSNRGLPRLRVEFPVFVRGAGSASIVETDGDLGAGACGAAIVRFTWITDYAEGPARKGGGGGEEEGFLGEGRYQCLFTQSVYATNQLTAKISLCYTVDN